MFLTFGIKKLFPVRFFSEKGNYGKICIIPISFTLKRHSQKVLKWYGKSTYYAPLHIWTLLFFILATPGRRRLGWGAHHNNFALIFVEINQSLGPLEVRFLNQFSGLAQVTTKMCLNNFFYTKKVVNFILPLKNDV